VTSRRARFLWPDRIATRIALIMVAAMLLTQGLGYLLFLGDRNGWWPQSGLDAVIERLRGPIELAAQTPPDRRAEILRTMSAFQLDIRDHFDPKASIVQMPPLARLRDHLLRAMPHLVTEVLMESELTDPEPGPVPFGFPAPPDQPAILWLRLKDGSWLTVTMPFADLLPAPPFFPWLPWVATFLAIIAISLLAARGISRSLRHLAGGAEQLGIHMNAVPLAVAGPREIRSVTRAFNRMQDRLKRFVADRTQMLAAISHDLRTPLSRLRLRAEALAAGSERDRILADLALMDRMIAATLSFARDDAAREKRVMVDLASLVHSVCDEIVDAGGDATYQGPAYLAIEAAPPLAAARGHQRDRERGQIWRPRQGQLDRNAGQYRDRGRGCGTRHSACGTGAGVRTLLPARSGALSFCRGGRQHGPRPCHRAPCAARPWRRRDTRQWRCGRSPGVPHPAAHDALGPGSAALRRVKSFHQGRFRAFLPAMSVDQPQRLNWLPSISLARQWPVLGWLTFYLLIAASWGGLVWTSAAPGASDDFVAAFVARCLAPGTATGFATLVLMWALMSLGMMLPTSLPTLRRFATLVLQGGHGSPSARFLAFLLAYIAVWLSFSLAAAALQFMLARLMLTGLMLPQAESVLAAILLTGAGLYQFSRLKHACLTRCRHPMTFFMVNWRDRLRGAAAMGLRHGRDCLGCCWALMLLALIGGSMNLAWMGLGMLLMVLEKLAGTGRFVTIPLGLILIAAAGFSLGASLFAI
jgi:predicted metal-binding membrane protein